MKIKWVELKNYFLPLFLKQIDSVSIDYLCNLLLLNFILYIPKDERSRWYHEGNNNRIKG